MKIDRDRISSLPRVALVLDCLYAPYAWLVLMSCPWDFYR
jgi:hypothetical protein